ncbi:Hypothetical_protein [Hexamita inflata]|uniref:Hypothetical_protein n=1 Tax=Hexamita inflata TaxID=28002 RepID=A0AA86TJA1_9EUKA|nr:Hypothetical protein HINF_LOCUS8039 [Hexamita inflata]
MQVNYSDLLGNQLNLVTNSITQIQNLTQFSQIQYSLTRSFQLFSESLDSILSKNAQHKITPEDPVPIILSFIKNLKQCTDLCLKNQPETQTELEQLEKSAKNIQKQIIQIEDELKNQRIKFTQNKLKSNQMNNEVQNLSSQFIPESDLKAMKHFQTLKAENQKQIEAKNNSLKEVEETEAKCDRVFKQLLTEIQKIDTKRLTMLQKGFQHTQAAMKGFIQVLQVEENKQFLNSKFEAEALLYQIAKSNPRLVDSYQTTTDENIVEKDRADDLE